MYKQRHRTVEAPAQVAAQLLSPIMATNIMNPRIHDSDTVIEHVQDAEFPVIPFRDVGFGNKWEAYFFLAKLYVFLAAHFSLFRV